MSKHPQDTLTSSVPTDAFPGIKRWLVLFVAATLLLGAVLRWDLATAAFTRAGLDFGHLRHAHSHVGFYGFLTLAWWLVAARDTRLTRTFATTHALIVSLATLAFALMGYAAPTIVLSTVVAIFWLVSAWRARHARGWFRLVPWGIVVGMVLIVPIAITARRDFLLSRDLAHVFVAALLLLSFVPAALGALRIPTIHPLAWAATALPGAVQLVFQNTIPFPVGWLTSLGGLLLLHLFRPVRHRVPRLVALSWLGLGAGMVVMGLLPPLQTEAMRVVALHFTVLFPIGLTFLHVLAPTRASNRPVALTLAVGAAALMLLAMAVTPWMSNIFGASLPPTVGPTLAAIGGTGTVIGVVGLLRP